MSVGEGREAVGRVDVSGGGGGCCGGGGGGEGDVAR